MLCPAADINRSSILSSGTIPPPPQPTAKAVQPGLEAQAVATNPGEGAAMAESKLAADAELQQLQAVVASLEPQLAPEVVPAPAPAPAAAPVLDGAFAELDAMFSPAMDAAAQVSMAGPETGMLRQLEQEQATAAHLTEAAATDARPATLAAAAAATAAAAPVPVAAAAVDSEEGIEAWLRRIGRGDEDCVMGMLQHMVETVGDLEFMAGGSEAGVAALGRAGGEWWGEAAAAVLWAALHSQAPEVPATKPTEALEPGDPFAELESMFA